MANLTTDQQKQIRNLFDGYRSVSTETQNMFLQWLFDGGNTPATSTFTNIIVQQTAALAQAGTGAGAEIGNAKLLLGWSDDTPGLELYLRNESEGGTVIIAGGSSDGTGITMIGATADKIGFFDQDISAVRQTMTAAAPVVLADCIAQINSLKTSLAAYNLLSLT